MDEDEMTFEELRARMQPAVSVVSKSGPRPVVVSDSDLITDNLKIHLTGSTFLQVSIVARSFGLAQRKPLPSVDAASPVMERVPAS